MTKEIADTEFKNIQSALGKGLPGMAFFSRFFYPQRHTCCNCQSCNIQLHTEFLSVAVLQPLFAPKKDFRENLSQATRGRLTVFILNGLWSVEMRMISKDLSQPCHVVVIS